MTDTEIATGRACPEPILNSLYFMLFTQIAPALVSPRQGGGRILFPTPQPLLHLEARDFLHQEVDILPVLAA